MTYRQLADPAKDIRKTIDCYNTMIFLFSFISVDLASIEGGSADEVSVSGLSELYAGSE